LSNGSMIILWARKPIEEVLNLFKSLPNGKSIGYDLMDNFVFILCCSPDCSFTEIHI
jgi:hypothetical protein